MSETIKDKDRFSALKFLRPEQYASWLRKVDDPDWANHRYRDSKDNVMANAIRELRDSNERVIQLERALREIRKIFDRQNNAICGNEQLSGCEEFYKGYNVIVRQENEASRVGLKIIDAALEGK